MRRDLRQRSRSNTSRIATEQAMLTTVKAKRIFSLAPNSHC
jgi:hypothetical protein